MADEVAPSIRRMVTRKQKKRIAAHQSDSEYEDCEPDQKRHLKSKNDNKPSQKIQGIKKSPASGFKAPKNEKVLEPKKAYVKN